MSMMDVLIAPLDVFRRGAQMLAEANSTEWSGLVPHPPVGHVEPCEQDRDAFTAKLLWEIMALPVRGSYLYSPGSWERGRWRDWHQQRKTLEPDPYYPLFGLVALNFSASGRNYLRFSFDSYLKIFLSRSPSSALDWFMPAGRSLEPHPGCVEAWNTCRSRTKPLYESDGEPKLLLEFRTVVINAFAANRPSALT